MTASVSRGLVERPQALALPLAPHVLGDLPEGRGKRNPRQTAGAALCDENAGLPVSSRTRPRQLRYLAYQGLQLHGLQSRPESTKYLCAATAWPSAFEPCPKRRRSYEPIWKSPRYWPFCAVVR